MTISTYLIIRFAFVIFRFAFPSTYKRYKSLIKSARTCLFAWVSCDTDIEDAIGEFVDLVLNVLI